MDELIAQVTALLSANPGWVVAIAALAGFVEALLVVGAFIPGTTILALIGGLAAGGLVDPFAAALAAILGAIAGDTVTYLLGRLARRPVLRWRLLRPHWRKIAWARLFFRRYGIWSILLARFFGPLRATLPLIAGAFAMRALPFQLANIASAILWVPAAMAPGWLAAKGIAGLGPETLPLALVGLTLALTIIPLLILRRAISSTAHPRRRRTT